MILATVIAVFFLNKFLFYIHGYNIDLTKDASVEAFAAYKAIYKSKVVFVIAGLVLSVILLLFARKLTLVNPLFIYTVVYGICWLMAITFLIFCVFFIILPKGPLV
jgi:hypothetical protein